jgi:hypothetical protein
MAVDSSSVQQLEDVKKYISENDRMTSGLHANQHRKVVQDYAEMNQIPRRLNRKTNMAGMDWLTSRRQVPQKPRKLVAQVQPNY